jgi:hypothetical protein
VQPLTWPDCRNVRDLGGLRTADGELQSGRLIRSDNLDQLTPTGLTAVDAAGVSRFVDLRTGVVVAMTLDLVGVPQEVIAADYEASGAPPDLMLRLLSHLREQHGGTHAYLLRAGMTAGQLGGLRSRLRG